MMTSEQKLPLIMDFFSPQSEQWTRIHPFFDNLKEGKFTTTKCKGCGALHWQPRVVCPECLSDDLEWTDLPKTGKLYSFSEMRAGAPTGMEQDVPFSIGIVELDDVGIKLLVRLIGPYSELSLDMPMELEPWNLPDGRIFYKFKPKV